MSANWEIVDPDEGVVVHLSDEGLRRAANDNDLLNATALAHEILAGTACGGIVVALVWAIFRSF